MHDGFSPFPPKPSEHISAQAFTSIRCLKGEFDSMWGMVQVFSFQRAAERQRYISSFGGLELNW
ncbi:MAG: hypothetical protein WA734_05505, partial [Candidatus Acidiferrales bacterium]